MKNKLKKLLMITGEKGINKNPYLFDELIKYKNRKKLIITNPTNIENIQINMAKNGIVGECISYTNIYDYILKNIGFNVNDILSSDLQPVIISYLLCRNRESLIYLNADNYDNQLSDKLSLLFNEFYSLNIDNETLERIKDSIKFNLKDKFRDILEMKYTYEDILKDFNIYDVNRLKQLALEKISDLSLDMLFVDQLESYDNFTLSFLENLLENSNEIIAVFNTYVKSSDYSAEICQEDIKGQRHLQKCIQNKLFNVERKEVFNKNNSNVLFDKKDIDLDGVSLTKCRTTIAEVENMFFKINELLSQGITMDEICVVCSNFNEYKSIINQHLIKNNLNANILNTYSIKENHFIKYLLALFDVYKNGFTAENIIDVVNNPIMKSSTYNINCVEDFFIRFGNDVEIALSNGYEFNIDSYNIVMTYIQKINNHLDMFSKESQDYECFSKSIFNVIGDVDYINYMIYMCNTYINHGKTILSSNLEKEWNSFISLIDNLDIYFHDIEMTLLEYVSLFEKSLSETKIKADKSINWLNIYSVDEMLYKKYNYVFFIGCNEGYIVADKEDSLINDYERTTINKILLNKNIETRFVTLSQMYSQNVFKIYTLLNCYNEKMYLSYSEYNIDSKELLPSSVMKKIFNNLNVNIMDKNNSDEIRFIHLLNCLSTYKFTGKRLIDLNSELQYFQNHNQYKVRLQNALNTFLLDKSKFNVISKNKILNAYDKIDEFSITRLENMNSCQFKHFMNYAIKPLSVKVFDENAADVGNFFHKIYFDFYNYVIKNTLNIDDIIANENIYKELYDKIYNENLIKHNEKILLSSPKFKYLATKLYVRGYKSLLMNLKQLRKGSFKPIHLEYEVKNDIETSVGTKKLVGIIDRIDECNGNVRVIDYKSGNVMYSDERNQVGLQLQLQLYLKTASIFGNPVGMYYYHMINPNKNINEDEEKYEKKFVMSGLTLNNRDVINNTDRNLQNEKSSSTVINVDISAKDEITKRSKVINEDELNEIFENSLNIAKVTIDNILNGNTVANPQKLKDYDACEYCKYNTICQKNQSKENNE